MSDSVKLRALDLLRQIKFANNGANQDMVNAYEDIEAAADVVSRAGLIYYNQLQASLKGFIKVEAALRDAAKRAASVNSNNLFNKFADLTPEERKDAAKMVTRAAAINSFVNLHLAMAKKFVTQLNEESSDYKSSETRYNI